MNFLRRPASRGSRMPHSAALALNALARRLSRLFRSRHRAHVRNPGVGADPHGHSPAARFAAFLRFQTSPAWRRHSASSRPSVTTWRNAPRLQPAGHSQPRSIGSSSGTGVARWYRPGPRRFEYHPLAVWVCSAESGCSPLAPPSLFREFRTANVRPRETPDNAGASNALRIMRTANVYARETADSAGSGPLSGSKWQRLTVSTG